MRLQFPYPERDFALARAETAHLVPHLEFINEGGLALVKEAVWRFQAQNKLAAILVLIYHLFEAVFPPYLVYGRSSLFASHLFLNLLVVHTLLRFKKAAADKRPPRWIARAARLLPPGLFDRLVSDCPVALAQLRQILEGNFSGQGIVYGLFGQSALYVGKTVLRRASGALGLQLAS